MAGRGWPEGPEDQTIDSPRRPQRAAAMVLTHDALWLHDWVLAHDWRWLDDRVWVHETAWLHGVAMTHAVVSQKKGALSPFFVS